MYDNIYFYLKSEDTDSNDLLGDILNNGNDITVEKIGETANNIPFAYISLKGKNDQKLSFKVLPYQVSMMGKNSSICKYFLGNNFETLTLSQFKEAINEISDRLGVDVSKAIICRIDVATNFSMKFNPSAYNNCLIHYPRHKKGKINGNLYFKTTRKELNFYDKVKEYKQKKVKIPLLGIHNVRNSVAAAAVSFTIGVSIQNIKILKIIKIPKEQNQSEIN